MYFRDQYNPSIGDLTLSLEKTSKKLNQYRWKTGWRIEDSEDKAIKYSGILTATPTVFILETATMKIVAIEPPDAINVLSIVTEINEK